MATDDFASPFPFLPSSPSFSQPSPLPLSRALLIARDGPIPPLRTRTSHYSSPPSSIYSPTPSEAACAAKRQRAFLTPAQLVSHGRKNIARPFPLPCPPRSSLSIVDEASELGRKASVEVLLTRKVSTSSETKVRRKRSENDSPKPTRPKSKPKSKTLPPPSSPIVKSTTTMKGFISSPRPPRPTSTPLAEVCSFNFTVGEIEDVFGPSERAPRSTGFPAPMETVWEKRERKKLRELTRKFRAIRLEEQPDNG